MWPEPELHKDVAEGYFRYDDPKNPVFQLPELVEYGAYVKARFISRTLLAKLLYLRARGHSVTNVVSSANKSGLHQNGPKGNYSYDEIDKILKSFMCYISKP